MGACLPLKNKLLRKETNKKTKILNDATLIQEKLLSSLLKHSAVNKVISEKENTISPPKTRKNVPDNDNNKDDMFKLPEPPSSSELDSTLDSDDSSENDESSTRKQWDIHTIDETSIHFRSLPADVRHDILTDIKDQRKQSSWGRLHELPKKSSDFSTFQMKRLLKRNSVQVSLDEATKEMGGHTLSLGELETLMTEEGIVTASKNTGSRIASDENKRYLLIKDVKKAMEKAKNDIQDKETLTENTCNSNEDKLSAQHYNDSNEKIATCSNDNDYERDLEAAIQLSLLDTPSTSKEMTKDDNFLDNFKDGDFESDSESDDDRTNKSILAQAKSYMIEYSGLTPNEIAKIIEGNSQNSLNKKNRLEVILENESRKFLNNSSGITSDNEIEDNNHKNDTSEIFNLTSCITLNEHKVVPVEDIAPVKYFSDSDESETNLNENIVGNAVNKILADLTDAPFINEKDTKSTKNDISDSDDSDLVEVDQSNSNKSKNKPPLEVIFNPQSLLQDDIFSDIFTLSSNKNQRPIKESETHETVGIKEKTLKEKSDEKLVESKLDKIDEKGKIDEIKAIQSDEVSSKKISDNILPNFTIEQLNNMQSKLIQEQDELMTERNNRERMAGNITDQMYQEAQELLELFGVPYIIAPMEAEAQCAFLNDINLTDGTITDDSDIWLFGGQTVYKNFFNQKKHVLEFRAERIKHYFKLSREQMILLALLVGSDYTVGIQGIGPVTALEILASFPPSQTADINILTQNELVSGLAEFRSWLSDGRLIGPGRTALRSKLQNINVTEGFPSVQVVQAYLQPEVETCRDSFSWGRPDIVGLIDFAKEKFGWTRVKSEEILKPVIKKLGEKSMQKSIKDYFATKHKLDTDLAESKMSKRVKTAVKRMGKKPEELQAEEKASENAKSKKKGIQKSTKNVESSEINISKPKTRSRKNKELHAKDIIPQKERDKLDAFKSKLKAIEVFRKSKQGPGFLKKRQKILLEHKEETELSESSESS